MADLLDLLPDYDLDMVTGSTVRFTPTDELTELEAA